MEKEVIVFITSETQRRIGSRWITCDYGELWLDRDSFERSFIRERWQDERRTQYGTTRWGNFQHRQFNYFDSSYRVVRNFHFKGEKSFIEKNELVGV